MDFIASSLGGVGPDQQVTLGWRYVGLTAAGRYLTGGEEGLCGIV